MVSASYLLYLEPNADERDVSRLKLKTLVLETGVSIAGSLVSFYDPKKQKTKHMPSHCMLQINEVLTDEERDTEMKRHRQVPVSEVYYLKIFWAEETELMEDPRRFNPQRFLRPFFKTYQNPGDKPFGIELIVTEKNAWFIIGFTKNFMQRIIIPMYRVKGIDTPQGGI